MKRLAALALGLGLVGSIVGCAPRGDMPAGVRSLRHQRARGTITLPTWTIDVAEEVATTPDAYAGKTLVIEHAYLDPAEPWRVVNGKVTCGLRGGGTVVMRAKAMPAWLRTRTGAPVRLRARLHPPRISESDPSMSELLLRVTHIDFAHPLELAFVAIEERAHATWLIAHVENYRGEPASAEVDARFANTRYRGNVGPLAPGEGVKVEVKLYGDTPPEWRDLPPKARRLQLRFDDGSEVAVDIGQWLEGPMEGLLDWGYSHTGVSTAAVALSADRPEAELERFAALELRSHLHQLSDANIEPREPTDREPLPPGPLFVVGTARHNPLAAEIIRKAGLEPRVRAAGAEGYVLKSLVHNGHPTLLVTAHTPRGLVNGVYGLLLRYGARITLSGVRLPARGPLRVPTLDDTVAPLFAHRSLVAVSAAANWTAQWSQWDWLAMLDAAAKTRFNEVVVPLDGLEATFAYAPRRSRDAVFPFEVGPYTCVAQAYLAHQRGLGLLADVARRRGLALAFAHRDEHGALRRTHPPACLPTARPARDVGQVVDVLEDPGDVLSLPRVEDTAKVVAGLLRAKASALAVPFGRGARFRAGFLAAVAWDKALTPMAFYRGWAATVCEGEGVEVLAGAALKFDKLDGALLAAAPQPFGLGPAPVLPVDDDDLKSDWARLRARATAPATAEQMKALKAQSQKLREVERGLQPVYADLRKALGGVAEPWEAPMLETASASRRADRITLRAYMLRSLLGALASVQEGTLAYTAGLAAPDQALSQLRVAAGEYRKARRIMLWIANSGQWSVLEPWLTSLAAQVHEQAERLGEWLGPAGDAEPSARLRAQGSDAIIQLFRTSERNVYAVYKLAGSEVVHLRLNAAEARLFRRGQPTRTIRATGGAFLISIDTVPTYLVTRRTPWAGEPMP